MKNSFLEITENKMLAPSVYRMKLNSTSGEELKPGQFINIALEGKYLRRPISVCDFEKTLEGAIVTIIYKVVGQGTEQMAGMLPGEKLDVLEGLGNGYDLSDAGNAPLLIGGGVGVPPMYYLARKLTEEGKPVTVILGFNTRSEIFYEDEFKALGCKTIVTTVDGSCGIKGFVTDALPADYSYYYACGPEPMLKAVFRACASSGQMSFEERMGCGFGACMGCSCKTVTGYKRICKDGPVMRKEEILWEK